MNFLIKDSSLHVTLGALSNGSLDPAAGSPYIPL